MVCAGTPYMLATFGPTLKRRFHFTESQIMTVQSRRARRLIHAKLSHEYISVTRLDSILTRRSAQVGMYLGLLQGLYFDRFGVRAASLLAALLLFAGPPRPSPIPVTLTHHRLLWRV